MDANTSDVMTVEEAGERLGISRGLAYQMVKEGEIPHLRLGRRVVVPKAAFQEWLLSAALTRAQSSDCEARSD